MTFSMRLNILIILFAAMFSTVANSFPLSLKPQLLVPRRRVPYSVVPVDGGPKTTKTPPPGLLVTIPPRITETVAPITTTTDSSSPTSTERPSSEKSGLPTRTTVAPTLPPRTTSLPSASASSNTTLIYRPSSLRLSYTQLGPTGVFRPQPSHATIKISYPAASLIPPPRYGSVNGTYHLPTPSARFPN
ncbi:hypothetical protein BDBG_07440 [Blastomyces gilchristii SLH14081]|uniref:Uncharacterized protein n=1 Tax=Blastomyces gilchristii (strain SLH14081) TaxID=559298 RepID=A0A179UW61_BLAGS|nr:uncharacterized protein BDBG_07440 [Blastomyces gilchristii SLH14081]OAT12043.1 hypothetical protein BDBG_07440 [Blastomyces gilchristii SLH14081]